MKRYLLALAMLCVAAVPAMAQLKNGGFNGLPPWTLRPCGSLSREQRGYHLLGQALLAPG
jgi:hypothetical protein